MYRAPLDHAMLPIIHFVVGRQVLMFDSTYWYLDGRPITEVTGKFMYSDHTGRVQVNMLSGTFPGPFLYAIGMPSSGSANEDDTLIKFIEERPDLQQMIRDGKLVLMFDRGFSRTARARDYLRKLRALVLRPVMAKNVRLHWLFSPLFFLTHRRSGSAQAARRQHDAPHLVHPRLVRAVPRPSPHLGNLARHERLDL
jgi:hypothetical protein